MYVHTYILASCIHICTYVGLAMKPSWSDVKTALLEGFVRIGSLLVDTVQPTRKKHISSVEKPSDKLPTVSLSPFTAKFKEGMSSLQHTKTVTSQKLAAAQQLVNTSALQVDEAQRYSPLDKYNFRILLMQRWVSAYSLVERDLTNPACSHHCYPVEPLEHTILSEGF